MNLGVVGAKVKLISDEQYQSALHGLITNASQYCLCNEFIVDLSPVRDRELLVYSILLDLRAAAWRGVDTRLLVGGSRSNFEIARSAEFARSAAGKLGIPCRWMTSHKRQSTHAKWVVVDDWVLLGSHNWSSGAFSQETQDSILVQSRDLAAHLHFKFEEEWKRAAEVSEDV
jgi:phosphatidylserine/phosphatidylglycerophosphate/cardiolipin synthase-like enzyme